MTLIVQNSMPCETPPKLEDPLGAASISDHTNTAECGPRYDGEDEAGGAAVGILARVVPAHWEYTGAMTEDAPLTKEQPEGLIAALPQGDGRQDWTRRPLRPMGSAPMLDRARRSALDR